MTQTREQVRARLIELATMAPSPSLVEGWFRIVNPDHDPLTIEGHHVLAAIAKGEAP